MSKEIAQTLGGKRIAGLLAILAAFAVLATLGSRFDTAPVAAGSISSATQATVDNGATTKVTQAQSIPSTWSLMIMEVSDTMSASAAENDVDYCDDSGDNRCVMPYWSSNDKGDNATGSLQAVCLMDDGWHWYNNYWTGDNYLTDSDPWLTFSITNAPGSSATVHPGPGAGSAGPTGGTLMYLYDIWSEDYLPCVVWRSAGVGGQVVTAYVHSNMGQGLVSSWWNGYEAEDAPVIVEWNTIESTKIVRATGNVWEEAGYSDNCVDDEYIGPMSCYTAFYYFDEQDGGNSAEIDNWYYVDTDKIATQCVRDNWGNSDYTDCADRPNVDGTTITVPGARQVENGAVIAKGVSFIEYALGSHAQYSGPLDGARQTFALSSDSCGSMVIEDPANGYIWIVMPGQDITTLSSTYGVAFTLLTTNGWAEWYDGSAWSECADGAHNTVTITTREDAQLRSDLTTVATETVTVRYTTTPAEPKQPILAWAGQRVALEHNWGTSWSNSWESWSWCWSGPVAYVKQNGPGSFVGMAWDEDSDIIASNGSVFVVDIDSDDERWDNNSEDPQDDCVSTAVYESEDPGEVDVVAYLAYLDGPWVDHIPVPWSESVAFVIYYMKFESVSLGLVDGERADHNSGLFAPINPWNTASDSTSETANVSSDVLVRARVKGWFTNANPTGRAAGTDTNGGALPAGRWVMPDDWRQLAGGDLALEYRPNYDIMISPAGSYSCKTEVECTDKTGKQTPVVGPFSLVDGKADADGKASLNVDAQDAFGSDHRETYLTDGAIDMWDAPMPPALLKFTLSGSGFLREADKFDVYTKNPFYVTHIPAEPWISKNNARGGGYLWDSWDRWSQSGNVGPYHFWTNVNTSAVAVYSAPGKDAAKTTNGAGKVATGGYTSVHVYTDNHGEAMVFVNGDAGLTMEGCSDAASKTANKIVGLTGDYCENGDKVGASTVTAAVDYPDYKKHYPIAAGNSVSVNWTWGGIKEVNLTQDTQNPQFIYVVFSVTDRSGHCGDSPALHTVLGEQVDYLLDVLTGGSIIAAEEGTVGLLGQSATTVTFDTADEANAAIVGPTQVDDECQSWVKVSNSLLGIGNVIVTAHDPEGTVMFDRVLDFQTTATLTLSFRWSLVTWTGANNISVAAALNGTGANDAGNDISADVTAVYGWNAGAQSWAGYFPAGVNVPGANDLTTLQTGSAYWIAIKGPGSVTWTIATNVN